MPAPGILALFLSASFCFAAGGPAVAVTPSACPASELGASQLQASVSRSPGVPIASALEEVEAADATPPPKAVSSRQEESWVSLSYLTARLPPRQSPLSLLVLSYPGPGPAAAVLVLFVGVVWFMMRGRTERDECSEDAGGDDEGVEEEASQVMRTRALVRQGRSENVTDAMTYNAEGFMTWDVFFAYSFTIWKSAGIWMMAKRLVQVSLGTAVLELLLASDPSALEPLRFAQIGVVLNVFVGLLLSFFLQSSTNRWFECVGGFLTLGNCVRNLQTQLRVLGVEQGRANLAARYGVVSAWLLNFQMRQLGKPLSEQPAAREAMWEEMMSSPSEFSKLLPKEVEQLKDVSDYPGLVWIWVGSLVGRMAEDGEIPGMASPTYGRIVQLAQDAQGGMRHVRSTVLVQMPFAYVHTLATIVHINNILSAISFGLTLGASLGSVFVHLNPGLHLWNMEPHPNHLMIEDVQFITIQFFKCFLAPIVYQSFFEIGLGIAQPFVRSDGAIPVERLLRKLEADLQDADRMLDEPPSWKKPCFKESVVPKKP